MKLITTLYLGIGFILSLICLVTLGYVLQTGEVRKDVEQVHYASNFTKEEETAQKMMINMETGLRGYLLTGNPSFLEPYTSGQAHFFEVINRLDSLTKAYPKQNKLIHEIKNEANLWMVTFAEPLRVAKSRALLSKEDQYKYDSLFAYSVMPGKGKNIVDRIRSQFAIIAKEEELSKQARITELETSLLNTNIVAVLLTVLAIIAGILTANMLVTNIRSRFEKITSLALQIADGEYEVSIEDTRHDEISSLTQSLNKMARRLQRSFSHLTKVNQELDQFAYVVSHDLKAPLRAINNLSEWIAEDLPKDNEDILKNFTILRGRVQRMENLINGILEYSKVGRKELPKTTLSLQDLLEEVVENLSFPASFQVHLPDSLPVIQGERTLFYQIFSNLLSNAVRYHHQTHGIIHVRYEEQADSYRFEVEDDGPGIPEQYHQKIFKIFQTMEARDVKESTGVGLAIVKKIVEEKGGEIWIENAPPHGSKFIFTWPKAVAVSDQSPLLTQTT